MATTKTKGIITFSYEAGTLFNDVGLISAFMAKDLAGDNGSMLDSFAITDDERDVFDLCVKQALPNIFDELLKMSKCTDGYSNESGNISFYVKDNGAYNDNAVKLVDSTIYDCLKYGVLSEFYSICTNPSLFGIVKGKYEEMLRLLNQRLYQLKKRSISSLY
jgi:hypothetical protein